MDQSMESDVRIVHGTSGALIRVGNTVLKTHATEDGRKLLVRQAEYMQLHGAPFAEVLWSCDEGYSTERLDPLIQGVPLTQTIVYAGLSLQPLWCKPATLERQWKEEHWAYVAQLCHLHGLNDLQDKLWKSLYRIDDNCAAVTTHGDATLDNVLVKKGTRLLRWIDPIPPRREIPPLWAVDLGKLLQSADGYEWIKYGPNSGWAAPSLAGNEHASILQRLPRHEVHAALYFRAVAYLRGLRYFDGAVLDFAYKELECYSPSI